LDQDGLVGTPFAFPEERKLLETVATTFGLSDRIVKQLEDEYNSTLEEE